MSEGFRSLLQRQAGGAGKPASAVNPGFRSLLARHVGGASSGAVVANPGFRSMLARHVGGAASAFVSVPETPSISGPSGGFGVDRRYYEEFIKKQRDDDDILDILMSISHIL